MMTAWPVRLVLASQMLAQASLARTVLSLTRQPSRAGAQDSTHALLPIWPEHVTALGM